MHFIDCTLRVIGAALLLLGSQTYAADSDWVHLGRDGKLVYKTTATGDRIMDFSYAGYAGGGVALPDVAVAATLTASGGDDTGAIQASVDGLAALYKRDHAPRALLLRAGLFHLSRTLRLPSGVIVRGEGEVGQGTRLALTGAPHLGVKIGGPARVVAMGSSTSLSDPYIPSGASLVHVQSNLGLKNGDRVQITAPVTPTWLRFMGMDRLSRNSVPETWLSGKLAVTRTVVAVKSGSVMLQPALSHAYDARHFGTAAVRLTKVSEPGLTEQVGIENLQILAPPRHVTLSEPFFTGVSVDGTRDFWLRKVSFVNMTNDVDVGRDARRGTLVQVAISHSVAIVGDAKPFAFGITGTQILIDRCKVAGDALWYAATNRDVQGPNVVLNSRFEGNGAVEPHQRWATGLLVDGVEVPEGRIAFQNRGAMGSGHGWAIGWSVSWNNIASSFLIQAPPGTLNWSIGDIGPQTTAPMLTSPRSLATSNEPQGLIEQSGYPVSPKSLYLAQLGERLGPAALRALGY